MLHRYAGPFAGLSDAQRDAIAALTLDRYVDEIRLPDYLAEVLGLPPGTPAHVQAHAERLAHIEHGLRTFDDHTWITAILHVGAAGGWTALASMRAVRGCRAVPVAQSVGDPASSLPTHSLLRGFAYPALPHFDATRVPESRVFETSRLVVARPEWAASLLLRGEIAADALSALLTAALAELVVAAARLAQRLTTEAPLAAWIFNARPRLAVTVRDFLGLPLVPLYGAGAEPTPEALASPLDAPYFHRWRRELCRGLPPEVAQAVARDGVAAAVRHLAEQELQTLQDRGVTLPFLVGHDAVFEAAIRRLEALLARQPYRLEPAEAVCGDA